MTKTQASQTAAMVAALRARASERPEPLISDPWARALAQDRGFAIATHFEQSFRAIELWIAVRTAFLDHHIKLLTEGPSGIKQLVMLGAGFDTRAARLSLDGVTVFEIDTPHSQAAKQAGLARLEGYPIDAARYVPCNFEQQSFTDALKASGTGFQEEEPALFVWEGVTYYLTEEAVHQTLSLLAQETHPASVCILDYVGKRFIQQKQVREADRESLATLANLGEPMQWGCNDILPLLYQHGFKQIRSISFDEACLLLTGTYERERLFRFQSMAMCSRTRSLPLFPSKP